MIINTTWPRRTALIVLFAGIPGCITADPEAAINQTAGLADGRTDTSLSLEDAWAKPFTDRTGVWDGSSTLELQTALELTLRNDPELRRQLALVAEQQGSLAQSSLPPNPVVGFGLGIALDGMSPAPAMVQLMQQLTWIWTMSDRIDIEDRRLQATILDAANTVVDRASNVRSGFANLLHAEELVELREAYIQTTGTSLELTEALARAGELPMIDVDRARIDHRAAEAGLSDARRTARTRKLELLRLMGWPEHTTDFDVGGGFAQMMTADPPSEIEVIERAVIVRLDVAAAEQRVLAAEANARLQGWRRVPEVGLNLSWQKNFGGRTAFLPGASVSIPILDDGYAAIARAGAQVEAARLEAAIIREDAIKEARVALNQWHRARQQVDLFEDGLVASAREVVMRSEQSFKAGVTGATELLLTQRRMIQLEVELLDEKLLASLAWVDLENAVGGSFQLPVERPRTEAKEAS
jgi:cobalt-zinc-cadmium efflux system outer membrane protein